MRARVASRLAWSLWAVCVAGTITFVLMEVIRGQAPPTTAKDAWFNAQEALGAVVFPTIGAILASRRRDNSLGWLFLVFGLSFALSAVGSGVTDTSTFQSPAWQWGTWINTWAWVPGWFGMVTFLPLLFPTGTLPSRRWPARSHAAAARGAPDRPRPPGGRPLLARAGGRPRRPARPHRLPQPPRRMLRGAPPVAVRYR